MARFPEFWLHQGALSTSLSPISWLYGGIVRVRRRAYRSGWLTAHRVSVPVLIVGNIFVGGTGKSPLVEYIVRRLVQRGRRPGIVSRGFGGQAGKGPLRVTSGMDPVLCGDEPLMLFCSTGVPVFVGADRVAAAQAAVEVGCDVVVGDDGLQHYRLARDAEIVVIDAARRLGNGRLLPAGPLREPPTRLSEVDLVVANGGAIPETPFAFDLALGQPVPLLEEGIEMPGKEVHEVAGIGNPGRFFESLRQSGYRIQEHPFPDHHSFREDELDFPDRLPLLMTAKDAVKCRHLRAARRGWWVPVALLPDTETEKRIDRLLDKVLLI